MTPQKISGAIKSFWGYVEVRGLEDCWEWVGYITKYGYGACSGLYPIFGTNRSPKLAYLLTRGTIPKGLQVLHSCDNRRCCNPLHLRLGTHQENMRDMVTRGRESHYGVSQPGEINGSSKLTKEQVKSILKDTRTLKLISKDYGISKVRISQIKRKLAWKHVTKERNDE